MKSQSVRWPAFFCCSSIVLFTSSSSRLATVRGIGDNKKFLSVAFERAHLVQASAATEVSPTAAVAGSPGQATSRSDHDLKPSAPPTAHATVPAPRAASDADGCAHAHTPSAQPRTIPAVATSPRSSLLSPAPLTPAECVQLWMSDSEALQGLCICFCVCALCVCVRACVRACVRVC